MNDGASKVNLHFAHQSKRLVFAESSQRNRKHVSHCFYRVLV